MEQHFLIIQLKITFNLLLQLCFKTCFHIQDESYKLFYELYIKFIMYELLKKLTYDNLMISNFFGMPLFYLFIQLIMRVIHLKQVLHFQLLQIVTLYRKSILISSFNFTKLTLQKLVAFGKYRCLNHQMQSLVSQFWVQACYLTF